MSPKYLLADTNSLVYAYRAGGAELLDAYRRLAKTKDYQIAISNTIADEIEDGPLGEDIGKYIADRKIPILDAPKVEQELKAATTPEAFAIAKKNAGERSLIEIATRERVEGRATIIWSDDEYFTKPQNLRGLQKKIPGFQHTVTGEMLDQSYHGDVIGDTEYQRHLAGYRSDKTFGGSKRLYSFDPALSPTTTPAPDLPEADPAIRGPKDQRGFASKELLIGEVPRNTLIRSGGLLASGADLAVSAQRVAELLEQDNPTAAQSEATRAVARNAGGWVGGATAAAVVGTSGYLPASLVVADAMLLSKAFEKAVDLKENYDITHQTDKQHVDWAFNGHNWVRDGLIDTTADGRDNPIEGSLGANYDKARELGTYASAKAVELALGRVPRPQDPFDVRARADDQSAIDNPNWRRNPETEQWQRLVKTGVSGANDRGEYKEQIATPERAMELNREAVARIQHNIANGRETVAAVYLENYTAQRSRDFAEIPSAVQAVRPRPGEVLGSDGQLYRRGADGQWAGAGREAQGNLALELELTRMAREPSLEQFNTRLATLEARPAPTEQQRQQNQLLHQYRVTPERIELTPQWQQAIGLAVQRTREEHGISGPGALQLQRSNGAYAADSPIAHYVRDADSTNRLVAVTRTEDILQARKDVLARDPQQAPVPDSPELRIAAQSPQQREAQEQAMREANRLGLSREDTQAAAQLAAAAIGANREPDIVLPVDAATRVRTPATPEARQAPEPPSPAPIPPPLAQNDEPVPPEVQAHAELERRPVEPMQAVAGEPQAPLRPSTAQHGAHATPASIDAPDDALRRGSEGQEVSLLQYRLDRMGYRGPDESPLPQHGRFDTATEHGLRQFQQTNRLPPTGVVDPETVQALAVAQQMRAVRPASIEQGEAPPEPVRERAPAAFAQDAAPAVPPSTPPSRDEFTQARGAAEPTRPEPANPLPSVADAHLAPQAPPFKTEPEPERVLMAQASPPEPERVLATQANPLEPERAPFQAEPARQPLAAALPVHKPDERRQQTANTADASDRADPRTATKQAEPAEPPSAPDLSHFSPEDRAMIAKIRAGATVGLSDEHAAAAMLAAKRNGILDADRIGPVAMVDETLWIERTVPGFHTAVNVAQPAPQLHDTLRDTQQFNHEQAQQQTQARELEQQQQNEKQTNAMRPQL
ncbi:peptidoglycan-binding protein [Lysobacter sp. CA199]|uniref:peptidoglycan-binding protein n=1 Tax=Lysobacter sp. CA199 TaxID=3455608 RepID=UPI003F8D2609